MNTETLFVRSTPTPRYTTPLSCIVTALLLTSLSTALFFNGHAITLYAVSGIAAVLALLFVILCSPRIRLVVGYPGIALTLFAAWYAVTTALSSVPYVSAIELGTIGSTLAIYLIWRMYNAHHPAFPIRFLLLALGFAFTASMLIQLNIGFSPRAMFLNPNSAAGLLNLLWPAAALGVITPDRPAFHRAMFLLFLCTMWFALVADGSRGAIIGATVALSVIVLFGYGVAHQYRSTSLLLISFPISAGLSNWFNGNAAASAAASLASPGLAGQSRLTIWSAAWEMIQEAPLLGFGPGAFWAAYPVWRSHADRSAGFFVHNDYLEFWIESGLPALLIFSALGIGCTILYIQGIKRYRTGQTNRESASVSTFCFAGLLAVAAHSFVTFNLQMLPFLLLCAILIAELERTSGTRGIVDIDITKRIRRPLPMVSLLLLSLIPMGHFARTAFALDHIQQAPPLLASGEYSRAIEELRSARAIWAQPDIAWYLEADALISVMRVSNDISEDRRKSLVARVTHVLDQAEKRNPWRSKTKMLRGFLINDHPDLVDGNALTALRKSLRLDSRNVEARYALSQILERNDDRQQAIQVLKDGLTIDYNRRTNPEPLRQRLEHLQSSTNRDPTEQEANSHSTPWNAQGTRDAPTLR